MTRDTPERATPTPLEKANPQEIHEWLRAARIVYDNGKAAGVLSMQRNGVTLALQAACAVLQRALTDGAKLVLPLIELETALFELDQNSDTQNLLRKEPLALRDRHQEAIMSIAAAVMTVRMRIGRERKDAAATRVAKRIGVKVGPNRHPNATPKGALVAWRKKICTETASDNYALYCNIVTQLEAQPDPLLAGDFVLDAHASKRWKRGK